MLVGKDKVISYFKNIENISHFYIFCGEEGIGKKTTAEYIAGLLHCEGENKPCGECAACHQHKAYTHPDFVIVTEEDKTKKSISVETVRSVVSDMQTKPLLADKKIYIVPDADKLSQQAQNAFLKALEEAPHYVLIIMLAESEKNLLSTVLSRASVIRIPACTKTEMTAFLQKEYPDSNIEAAVSFADGNIGRAIKMLKEGDGLRDAFFDALCLKPHTEKGWIYPLLECFEKNKDHVHKLLMYFHIFLRDAVMIKEGYSDKIINTDKKNEISSFAQNISSAALVSCLDRVCDCGTKFGKGSNLTLWITNLLIGCRQDFVSK